MVGSNIRYYRKKNQLTQDDIAQICCVTRQAVSKWEQEKTEPDLETLSLIAKKLEITEEELIYGPDESEKRKNKVTDNAVFRFSFHLETSIGATLAVVLSYLKWKSIGWAILHGMLGWIYVIYYSIKY